MPDIEPLATPKPEPFACPNCGALYTLVRAEADGTSVSGRLACRSCGGALNGREGRFVLKYFLVDRPKIPARATRGKRQADCHPIVVKPLNRNEAPRITKLPELLRQ
jgi:hypothetical protein